MFFLKSSWNWLINFAFLNQQVVAELAAAHAEGKTNAGFDIDSDSSSTPKEDGTRHTVDAVEKQVRTYLQIVMGR